MNLEEAIYVELLTRQNQGDHEYVVDYIEHCKFVLHAESPVLDLIYLNSVQNLHTGETDYHIPNNLSVKDQPFSLKLTRNAYTGELRLFRSYDSRLLFRITFDFEEEEDKVTSYLKKDFDPSDLIGHKRYGNVLLDFFGLKCIKTISSHLAQYTQQKRALENLLNL